jgi:hypothetical protein
MVVIVWQTTGAGCLPAHWLLAGTGTSLRQNQTNIQSKSKQNIKPDQIRRPLVNPW